MVDRLSELRKGAGLSNGKTFQAPTAAKGAAKVSADDVAIDIDKSDTGMNILT